MDKHSNSDNKNNFEKNDPFGLGMHFWQNYISNFISQIIYYNFIKF